MRPILWQRLSLPLLLVLGLSLPGCESEGERLDRLQLQAASALGQLLVAESRLEQILRQSSNYDLIIIKAARKFGIRRLFAGSLANSVVQNCRCSVFSVYIPYVDGPQE